MKKVIPLFLLLLLVISGCSQSNTKEKTKNNETEEITLKVASLIPPMTDMLDLIKPLLKEDGINLEIVVLSDNVQPNTALANKEVDANFFQHTPYMEQYNESNGTDLVGVTPVYHALLGAYSKKYKTIEELPKEATIAIPNDPSNIGRSLVLMEKGGLITLKDGVGIKATQADIIENKQNYQFKEVDLLMLARTIDDVDMVTMLPAYAKPLGLTPTKDSLLTETDESDFAIHLVARSDNANSAAIKKLAERLNGPEIKEFLEKNYADIALPAF